MSLYTKLTSLFSQKNQHSSPPTLRLKSSPNPPSTTVNVLGLRFHWRHSWLPHIKEIRAISLRALNILKYLSHQTRGCSRKRLLPLFTALVRSILDYGAPIYGLAPHSQFSLLHTVQNAAIRYFTGPFRTSPASSLNSEASIPPPPQVVMANLLCSISQLPEIPTHSILFETIWPHLTHRNS